MANLPTEEQLRELLKDPVRAHSMGLTLWAANTTHEVGLARTMTILVTYLRQVIDMAENREKAVDMVTDFLNGHLDSSDAVAETPQLDSKKTELN